MPKISRNAPCPCGSGMKYKKCCLAKDKVINLQEARDRSVWNSVDAKLIAFVKSQGLDEEQVDHAKVEYYHMDDPDQELPEIGEPMSFLNWFFLDYQLEDGSRLMERFIAQAQDSLKEAEKQIAQLLLDSYPSLYEVTEVIPDKGLMLKDIFTNQELFVYEKTATKSLVKRTVITARVITIDDRSYIADIGPAFPPMEALHILEIVPKVLKKSARKYKLDNPLPIFLKNGGGSFFTGCFLRWQAAVQQMFVKGLRTTDGDKLVFVTAYYNVLNFEAAREGLKSFPGLAFLEDTPTKLEAKWVVEKEEGPLDNVVYGDITLTPRRLTLECKSQKRLKRGKKMLSKYLGKSIKHKLDKIQDTAQLMQENLSQLPKPSQEPQIPQEVENQLMAQFMEEHYRKWVDEKIPALGGKTPRQAVKNPKLREKLIWLLKNFEYNEERKRRDGKPWYDVNKIRHELGLEL